MGGIRPLPSTTLFQRNCGLGTRTPYSESPEAGRDLGCWRGGAEEGGGITRRGRVWENPNAPISVVHDFDRGAGGRIPNPDTAAKEFKPFASHAVALGLPAPKDCFPPRVLNKYSTTIVWRGGDGWKNLREGSLASPLGCFGSFPPSP